MRKDKFTYLIITILFVIVALLILQFTNLSNNTDLSKAIEIIITIYLIRVCYGCILYIRNQYRKNKYSYGIIMNLGLLLFLIINIFRHINLLILDWNSINIYYIYNNTLESFSYFAMLTLPAIVILSVYSIFSNFILIKKEGFKYKNLLGLFLGLFALLGLIGSQAIYTFTLSIVESHTQIVIKKFVDIVINVTLSYFYTLIIATLYCNIKAANHMPKLDKDFVIILGAKINEDGTLTPLLKGRADKAIEFGKKQLKEAKKKLYYIPSGGQGKDENISEGEAIKNYLIKQGIDEEYIIVENKSKNTEENMKFSNDIITKKKKHAKVGFSTTNYHVFRSGVIANECGIDCEGMGSATKWYYYTNALIREFIANLVHEKRRHIAMVILINISTITLLLLGFIFKLI